VGIEMSFQKFIIDVWICISTFSRLMLLPIDTGNFLRASWEILMPDYYLDAAAMSEQMDTLIIMLILMSERASLKKF
jgi:hypothetical protein